MIRYRSETYVENNLEDLCGVVLCRCELLAYYNKQVKAIFLVETHTYQPKFKVFEIRKTKDPLQDDRIDYQYYDPDFTRIQSRIHREKDSKRLIRLANEIVKRLQSISQRREDDSSSDSDSGFVDETRSLVVVPGDNVVLQARPAKENVLQKLIQSALRTGFDDTEDRTAPPVHRIPYDYDDN